jgi:hypothetical protein
MSNSAAERTVAGRFMLAATLRRGRSGLIWRATDTGTGKPVAVEEVDPPLRSEAELQERWPPLAQGARAAAAFHHPGALTLHDVVLHDERFYVISELVEGLTLDELVRRHGCQPPHRVARIGLDLLEVLEAAHQAGLTHLDLQPAHVLIGQDGRTRLSGLGLSALRRGQAAASSFLSPEQARGDAAGPVADLWGLGATLQAAVEGRPPFDGQGVAALATILYDQPRSPRYAGPLGPALGALLVKAPAGRASLADARRLLAPASTPGGRTARTAGAAEPAGASPGSASTMATAPTRAAAEAPVEADPPTAVLGDPPAAATTTRATAATAAAQAAASLSAGGRASRTARAAQRRQGFGLGGPRGRLAAAWRSLDQRARRTLLVTGSSLLLALVSFGAAVTFIGTTSNSAPAAQVAPLPTEAEGKAPTTTAAPASSSTSDTATTTSSTSTTVPPSSTGAVPVLPGWTAYTDPQVGYQLNYPAGWSVSTDSANSTGFHDPASATSVRVGWQRGTEPNTVAAEQQASQQHAGELQNYQQVALQATTYLGQPAAYLEYTFQNSGNQTHAAELSTNTHGHFVALKVTANDQDWSHALSTFSAVLGSFQPPTR